MCHFILLGLKENSDEEVLRRALLDSERPLQSSDMINVDDSWKFFTCTQMCDCGTAVGAAHREDEEAETIDKANAWIKDNNFEVVEQSVWLDEAMRKSILREQLVRDELEDGIEELTLWVHALRKALQYGLPEVGIVLHWNERSTPTLIYESKLLPLSHFSEDDLYELEENTLLVVTSDGGK